MPIQIETARYPVVIVRWQGANTDAQVAAYLDNMTQLVRRPEPKVFVYDALAAQIPSPTQRRMQSEWMKLHEATISRWGVGTAFVLDSAVMRGALTAVLWLAPVPNGHLVCATVEEAQAWAEQRVREASMTRAAEF